MRFFSKIVVISNICFILTMILRYVELGKKSNGRDDVAVALPFGQSELVIIGYCSILINILFFIVCILFFFINKGKGVPRWMYIFNGLIFIYQVLFFFTNLIP